MAKIFVLYLVADSSDQAFEQFKKNGLVDKLDFDSVEIYTLTDFESAFNQDEMISDQGWIKFMDAAEVAKHYDVKYHG